MLDYSRNGAELYKFRPQQQVLYFSSFCFMCVNFAVFSASFAHLRPLIFNTPTTQGNKCSLSGSFLLVEALHNAESEFGFVEQLSRIDPASSSVPAAVSA